MRSERGNFVQYCKSKVLSKMRLFKKNESLVINQKGFTLFELLLAIFCIGILASIIAL